ncbi:MAG: hypothetical protein ACTSQB_07525 [Candidatus Heimdallarchaeota archaeon]
MSDDELHFVPLEEIDELEDKVKPRLHKILSQKLIDMTPKILVDSPQPLNDYQSVVVSESDIKIPDFE